MPAISLVICLHQQRDLIARLLERAAGCYDDLVVVHDGPDTTGVREVVEKAGGRFFEGKREYQQEPHWPFAWGEAKHDWILRLDADEVPSEKMKHWLQNFRTGTCPPEEISGYTCIWPIWNGKQAVSKRWPAGRNFLFNRQRVRFFGMVEQIPVPDGGYAPLEMILHHEPVDRQSHSLLNLLARKTSYKWRERIAHSLLGKPTDLPCWRWSDQTWPWGWEQIRRQPLWTAAKRLVKGPIGSMQAQWRAERRLFPVAAFSGPLHLALICLKYRQLRRRQKKSLPNCC